MSDLGLLLRKAREQRGYTLDDIQEATKIRKRYLEAIEQGDYKVLPGSFYVRAFVKTYAETVGLDAEEVLRLYHKELPKPPAPETTAPENIIKPKSRSVQHNDRWGKIAVTALMWLFPILIIVVVYAYLSQHAESNAENSDRNSQITTDTASPSASLTPSEPASPTFSAPASPSVTPTPETVTLTETKKSGNKTYYDVGPAGQLHQLKIVASKPGWIGVQENNSEGKYLYNGVPQNTDEIVFDLTGTIYVNIPHPESTVIQIDDTVVDDGDSVGTQKFYFTQAEAGTETDADSDTQP
ncbi:helix-turn-helix domain-containing protein [Cohnella lubricantis]|uniref:Helix-turn-helix domain-containing protein n=1 Tax=Cohnella lubricantis TaxID=2163172 RepID=A0A841TKC6_9BACL|nr:helix-turn-helix domain-containing protein [Cohnella lubricantis]MBB6679650.1 helix-turn-helix domain-containing protein [Cohnella lubricantis]MBP2119892.1 cytoskeletal protein RodZ [Cohnella lubricantis]